MSPEPPKHTENANSKETVKINMFETIEKLFHTKLQDIQKSKNHKESSNSSENKDIVDINSKKDETNFIDKELKNRDVKYKVNVLQLEPKPVNATNIFKSMKRSETANQQTSSIFSFLDLIKNKTKEIEEHQEHSAMKNGILNDKNDDIFAKDTHLNSEVQPEEIKNNEIEK